MNRAASIALPLLIIAAMLASILAGCAGDGSDRIDVRADGAQDSATAAKVEAAEKRAQAANGKASQADAAAAQARADALQAAAVAEDERAAKRRAEDEARAERAHLAEIAADKARLGWWASLAGGAILAVAAGLSAAAWWYGLSSILQGVGLGLAVTGGVALTLGMAWAWLPVLAGIVIVGGGLALLMRRAGKHIDNHAERAAHADPSNPAESDLATVTSADEQLGAGTWKAVTRLRGRPVAEARKALERLARRTAHVPNTLVGRLFGKAAA